MTADRHPNGPPKDPNGFSASPNFSPSQKKKNGMETRKTRRNRGKDQLPPPAAKKLKPSAGSGKKSQNNLEELVAQTYVKGISILHQKHDDNASGSSSKKNKKKPGKPSEQKKKNQTWSVKDEMSLANTLLACSEGGKVKMAAFYKQAKKTLEFNFSRNTQLYDKMRTMRSRFWSINSHLSKKNLTEDQFAYRNLHEAALFKVWKQIWGNNVKTQHEEEDGHNTDQLPSQNNVDYTIRDEDGHNTDQLPSQNNVDYTIRDEDGHNTNQLPSQNNVDYTIRDEDHRPEESSAPFVKKMMVEVQSKIETLIDSLIRRISAATNLQPFSPGFGAEIGTGSCLCSSLSRRMKELIEGVRSVKELPGLDEAEARALQKKWRKHRVEELRVFCRSLELLQEECNLCLQELEK